MCEDQSADAQQILCRDSRSSGKCRVRNPCLDEGNIGTMPINAKRQRDLRRQPKNVVGHCHSGNALTCRDNLRTQLLLLCCVCRGKGICIPLVGNPTADHLHAAFGILLPRNSHRERKAIEKLRADISLLRIHRTNEDKPCRMRIGNPLALHGVDAHCSRVEQDIDDMILKQVDLIHIEDIAVRRRQNTGLERLASMLDRRLHVERPDHAVLRRTDGQLHHAHWNFFLRQLSLRAPLLTGIAVELGARGIAVTGTTTHGVQIRQECSGSAYGSGFCRSLLPLDEHTAERRHDNTEEKCRLHLFLPNDCSKRVNCSMFH